MIKQNIHTLSIYVTNKPGVLSRISTVFARRGFNIESLVVSPAHDAGYSRMTITAEGAPESLEQIIKQVDKLVDVIQCSEHSKTGVLEVELALIKVKFQESNRLELFQMIQHFKAFTVDFTESTLVIRVTGVTEKIDSFVALLQKFNILEIVRTGKVLMARGPEKT